MLTNQGQWRYWGNQTRCFYCILSHLSIFVGLSWFLPTSAGHLALLKRWVYVLKSNSYLWGVQKSEVEHTDKFWSFESHKGRIDDDKENDHDIKWDLLFFCESTWPYVKQNSSFQAHSHISPHLIFPLTCELRRKDWVLESLTFHLSFHALHVSGWASHHFPKPLGYPVFMTLSRLLLTRTLLFSTLPTSTSSDITQLKWCFLPKALSSYLASSS